MAGEQAAYCYFGKSYCPFHIERLDRYWMLWLDREIRATDRKKLADMKRTQNTSSYPSL